MYRDNARPQGGRVCNFYQQGRCKFGDSCKFEHPGSSRPQESTGNRFSALSNQPANTTAGRGRTPGGKEQPVPYHLSKESIITDLKNERPQWPFSAYGAGRDAPRQLFGGFPLEQSMEEMRVLYYEAQLAGNVQAAVQSEQELFEKSNQQVQQVLNDVDGAIKYILEGDNEHPNRRDQVQASNGGAAQQSNPFSTAQTTGSAFGEPTVLGAGAAAQSGPSAPAFGKPSTPFGAAQPTAFGQPSVLGGQATPISAFGQPSLPGQKSAFGQPSAPGHNSAFGQPSQPGQASAFGQPSQPGQASAFGQQSQPGQQAAFGQPSQPGQTGAFGQPSQLGQAGAFGQPSSLGQKPSTFGQPSAPTQASPFSSAGQGTVLGQPSAPASASPFAQAPSSQPSPFAQAPPSQSSPFGQPSSLGGGLQTSAIGHFSPFSQANQSQLQPASNPFSAKLSETPSTSPFAQPQPQPQIQQTGAFGRQSSTPAFGQPAQPAPSPFVPSAGSSQQSGFGALNAPSPSPFSQAQTPAQQRANSASAAPGPGSAGTATPEPSSYITRAGNGQLRSFKSQPVSYINEQPHYRRSNDRTMERIWHPDGPPAVNPYAEEKPDVYASMGSAIEEQYRYLAQTGTFKDGLMPEVPPKREWLRFDL